MLAMLHDGLSTGGKILVNVHDWLKHGFRNRCKRMLRRLAFSLLWLDQKRTSVFYHRSIIIATVLTSLLTVIQEIFGVEKFSDSSDGQFES